MQYLQQAADGGSAAASANLGLAHLNGLGVPQDARAARPYFEAAARQGWVAGFNGLGYVRRAAPTHGPRRRRSDLRDTALLQPHTQSGEAAP